MVPVSPVVISIEQPGIMGKIFFKNMFCANPHRIAGWIARLNLHGSNLTPQFPPQFTHINHHPNRGVIARFDHAYYTRLSLTERRSGPRNFLSDLDHIVSHLARTSLLRSPHPSDLKGLTVNCWKSKHNIFSVFDHIITDAHSEQKFQLLEGDRKSVV